MTHPVALRRTLLTTSAALLLAASASAWTREVVQPMDWGTVPAVAVDDTGSPILAVGRGRLQVARWDGATWSRELVLDECGVMSDIAWHATGGLAVTFHNELRGLLQLGWLRAGTWVIHDLPAVAPSGGSRVVFDAVGRPFVAYRSHDDSLGHVLRWDGGWVPELPPVPYVYEIQATTDPAGQPVVAFSAESFATWDGAGWTSTETGLSRGSHYDIVFSRAGVAAIALSDTHEDVIYASAATGWTEEVVGTLFLSDVGGVPVGLAFDASDEPVVVVEDLLGVMAYRREAGSWLDPVEIGSWAELGPGSVVADAAGNVFVGHANLSGVPVADVRLSRWTGDWSTELLASERQPSVFTELAFDATDTPVLVSFQPPGLRSSQRVAGAWEHEWIAEDDVPGFPISLISDADSRLALAYHHDRRLLLGRELGGTWVSEPLEQQNAPWLALAPDGALTIAVGGHGTELWFGRHDEVDGWAWELVRTLPFTNFMFQSLAHDAAGRPVVAYHDRNAPERTVEVARRGPGGWVPELVDSGVVVENTHLARAPDGTLWLAYGTRSDTRLAHEEAGGWTVEVLPGVAARSEVALGFEPDGEPVLAVVSDGSSGPVYLAREGGAWSAEVIDPRLPESQTVALAFDADGRPAVGYYSRCRGEILYARPDDRLLRGWVASFDEGWHFALPLTEANDVETGGLPATVQRGDTVHDELVTGRGMLVYRVLTDDDALLLRVARDETGVSLTVE
ncbi:MAG: hypothetical protein AAF533_23400 [Acidobacteriota bacterium]